MGSGNFEQLVDDVVDEAMRDWGRAVVLATVSRVYDPTAGVVQTELVSSSVVTGIVSHGAVEPNGGTAAQERSRSTVVLVRASDYGLATVVGRIVHFDEEWFDVVSIDERTGGLVALSLVERSVVPDSGVVAELESGVAA